MTSPSQYEARIVLATLGYTAATDYRGTPDEQDLIKKLDDAIRHQNWVDWVALHETSPGIAYAVFLQAATINPVEHLLRLYEHAGLR